MNCDILVLVILIEKMGTVLQLSMTLNSITAGALFGILTMGCMMPKVHGNVQTHIIKINLCPIRFFI